MAKLSVDQALLKAQSHMEEAQKLYKAILHFEPNNLRAQKRLAALNKTIQPAATHGPPQETINQLLNLYNKGQLEAVVEQAQALTEQYPEAFIVWNLLGAAHKDLKKTVEASAAFKRVTELNSAYADGFKNLGVFLLDQSKLDEAIAAFKKALSLKPDYAEVYYNMGNAYQEQGKLEEAIEAYNKALAIKPDYAAAYNNMGNALQDQGKLDEAVTSYNKALSVKPDYAVAYYNMGNAFRRSGGRLIKALAAYRKASSLKPDFVDAWNNIGNSLRTLGSLNEAILAFDKALSLKPDRADLYNNKGNILRELGKPSAAIDFCKKAISLKPDYADAYYNMGNALMDQGKSNKAIEAYTTAISIKTNYASAYRNLSTLINFKSNHPMFSAVDELLKRPNLDEIARCELHYAFAKMNEDIGHLDVAFESYVAGGKLRKKLLSYDFKQDELIFDQIKATAPRFKELTFKQPVEAANNTPIFILGMPRSGTTLVEQIISSHSHVHGAGELPFWNRFGGSISSGNQVITSENVLKMRNAYLNELKKVSNGCQFVTDKMPQNFRYIGLLLKALPEAKVIHVKRDPAATCWSNFKHYFSATGLTYSWDLKDTVKYFKLYQDLMELWNQQYSEYIYHLDYEKLTIEQEAETRKLIQHLGLDWEDNCLSPQDNKRSVKTLSQKQVRQKVYKGSSDAWRKFEPYLNGRFDEFEHSSAPPPK